MSILPASGMGDESTGFYSETIDQSVRFNGSSSQLNITPSSTGNRRTFTTSLWVKRSKISSAMEFHTGGSNSSNQLSTQFGINSSDQLQFYDVLAGVTNYAYVRSSNILRDTTNWYHIVLAVDTTQSTASNRVKLYLNGSEVSYVSSPTYPDQNHQTVRNNSGTLTRIGRFPNVAVNYFNGYIAEFNHIDGTALDPTSFGETKNGVWIPKAISGLTYGTNGFRLTFADSSDIGNNANSSDGTNDHSVSGLAATDVLPDSPTNNFCTLNPLSGGDHDATLSEGALKASGADQAAIGTFGMTSGKWYWEGRCGSIGGSNFIGVVKMNYVDKDQGSSHSDGRTYANNGYIYVKDASSSGTTGTTYTTGDIIGVAVDLDNGTVKWYKNGTVNTNSEVTDLNSHADGHQGWLPWTNFGNATGDFVLNFGQDSSFTGLVTAQNNSDGNGQGDFYYTPPSGYLALCSSNLPEVTISPSKATQGDDHLNTVLYTGNGTSQSITGVGFQPDWVWAKSRDDGGLWHFLLDSVRGGAARLYSNGTGAESSSVNNITSFDADGFSVGSAVNINANNDPIVAWNWKAGGAPSADNSAGAGNTPTSNSVKIDGSNLGSALAGTIPATRLSANTTAGFSIVTYTGTGTQSDTVAHGLGKKPAWVIVKSRSEAQNWHVYHEGLDVSAPENYIITLNATNARSSSSADFWNSTAPTTSVMSVGDDNSSNKDGVTYVMYCFAEIEGYSKFGRYTGNGETSADGTYVFLGFRPQWVLIKRTDSSSGWLIWDNKRSTFNPADDYMTANDDDLEQTGSNTQRIDFLSNGFKAVNTATSNTINGSGTTHIYMAFAEQPFKFSNAR